MTRYRCSPGFSLLEIVVAFAVSGILMLSVMGADGMLFRSTKSVQGEIDWETLQNDVLMILNNKKLCAVAFRDANGAPAIYPSSSNPPSNVGKPVGNVAAIYLASGPKASTPQASSPQASSPQASGPQTATPIAVVGKAFGTNLTVLQISLIQTGIPSDTYANSGTLNRSYAQLYIKVSRATGPKKRNMALGSLLLDNAATGPLVTLLTDPNTGEIVQCFLPSAMASTGQSTHIAFGGA